MQALADPTRRLLLDRLHARNGQTLGELCQHLEMTRQSATQRLGVLEAANLVATVRRGREKLHYLRSEGTTAKCRWRLLESTVMEQAHAPAYRLVRRPVPAAPAARLDEAQQAVVDHSGGPLLVLRRPRDGQDDHHRGRRRGPDRAARPRP